jgi:hypothetical protein
VVPDEVDAADHLPEGAQRGGQAGPGDGLHPLHHLRAVRVGLDAQRAGQRRPAARGEPLGQDIGVPPHARHRLGGDRQRLVAETAGHHLVGTEVGPHRLVLALAVAGQEVTLRARAGARHRGALALARRLERGGDRLAVGVAQHPARDAPELWIAPEADAHLDPARVLVQPARRAARRPARDLDAVAPDAKPGRTEDAEDRDGDAGAAPRSQPGRAEQHGQPVEGVPVPLLEQDQRGGAGPRLGAVVAGGDRVARLVETTQDFAGPNRHRRRPPPRSNR